VLIIREQTNGAAMMLQRIWPDGIPGLKNPGHTAEQLDAIAHAIDLVEAEFHIPFGETDPRTLASMARHPSVSSLPAKPEQTMHPAISRAVLVNMWGTGVTNERVLQALVVFAGITPEDEWSDDDLETMLIGTLRAMGYLSGLSALPMLTYEEVPYILSAALAISSGSAMLLFDAEEKPVVRFNVQTIDMQKGAGT
jgi:hypothetical protein